MSEKKVVAGQDLLTAHRQVQRHDEKASVCSLANHTEAEKKNKKSACQMQLVSYWFAFPKCQPQTASKVKLFQLVFEVQLI